MESIISRLEMSKTNEIDMLHGPLVGKLFKFAMPFAISSMLQQLFNAIDIAVVGNFASNEALAAVGANGPVIALLLNFFIGISLGTNVIIANHIGQRNEKGVADAVSTSAVIALVSGFFLFAVGWFIAEPLLAMMNTPADIMDKAVAYLRIFLFGSPFILAYNFGAAVLRSMGDTKRPLYCLVAAGILNTILNLVLVICFKMDVAGVAIATTVSNMVSAVLIVGILLREKEPFRLKTKGLRSNPKSLSRILQVGLPAGLQSMIFAISNVFVQSAVNSYGALAVAGNAAALNYEFFAYFFISAFNAAAVTFIGQNYGAGEVGRCKRIFAACMLLSVVSCFLFSLLVVLNGRACLSVFTSDPEVISYGVERLRMATLWLFIASSYEISGSCMRGFGYSLTPAIITIFGTCGLRILWIYAVTPSFPGIGNLFLAYPVSWIITGVAVLVSYFISSREAFALVGKKNIG